MNVGDWQKKALIRNHPCFSQLTESEIINLAALLEEKDIAPGQTIVTEGDAVDSVYFIESGTAEVRHVIQQNNRSEVVPIAILNAGEAIGLSDVGLYSKTGKRTATVVAQSDMTLLRLDAKYFSEFLRTNPEVNTALLKNADTMARISLIKQAASFIKLSIEKMSWLAEQVETLSVKKDQLLFKKGDKMEYSYLIQEGEIEIFEPNPNGKDKSLATLGANQLFGATSLLMTLPSHVSARALKDSKLLVIKQALFQEVMGAEDNVAKDLPFLMKTKPKRATSIEVHTQKSDQETFTTLKDIKNDEYVRLNQEERFIWDLLDGRHSFHDITMAFYKQFNIFDPGLIASFIVTLDKKKFLEPLYRRHKKPFIFDLKNADEWLSTSYQKGIYLLYKLPVQIIFLILIVVGFIAFIARGNYIIHHLDEAFYSFPFILFMVLLLYSIKNILSGFAYAYAMKAFQKQIKSFCFQLTFLEIRTFCDTSDIWLSEKWPRLAVAMSGTVLSLLLAGIASIIALVTTNSFMILSLWFFSLVTYITSITNH